MNIEERAEALKIAREMHATDEANKLADLRGAHAGRAVLLYEVDALTAERDAWESYSKALRMVRAADHDGDAHADFEAKRQLAIATGALRALNLDPLA